MSRAVERLCIRKGSPAVLFRANGEFVEEKVEETGAEGCEDNDMRAAGGRDGLLFDGGVGVNSVVGDIGRVETATLWVMASGKVT